MKLKNIIKSIKEGIESSKVQANNFTYSKNWLHFIDVSGEIPDFYLLIDNSECSINYSYDGYAYMSSNSGDMKVSGVFTEEFLMSNTVKDLMSGKRYNIIAKEKGLLLEGSIITDIETYQYCYDNRTSGFSMTISVSNFVKI